ncbi:MAG TPA: 50S ribosomal protein L4 [bacterium]|nr:50S ribosomal protein L4 [bacterium]HPC29466.1 50S ribosomal protein L4 [bacterium]HRV03716.1 50S ribosomal protein L4 [Candidatus Ratteibacteria bacterium]
MKEIRVYNLAGEKVRSENIQIEDFNPNMDVIHRYVVAFLANQRQGNASTKTRSEVSGSGRKPWRQKGTGRARVGSIRTPVWRHGGIVFGPKNRDYSQRLPEKMKNIALKDVLKTRILEDKLILINVSTDDIKQPKTKIFYNFLHKTGFLGNKILVVLNKNFQDRISFIRCIRNIENLSYCYVDQINTYVLLNNDCIIAQSEVFSSLSDICSGERNV